MTLNKTLIATERIEPGQAIVIHEGLVRLAIPHVHKAKDIAGHATDFINKGESAWWDGTRRVLQRKPLGRGQ